MVICIDKIFPYLYYEYWKVFYDWKEIKFNGMDEVPRIRDDRKFGSDCPPGYLVNGFAVYYHKLLGLTGFAIDCHYNWTEDTS